MLQVLHATDAKRLALGFCGAVLAGTLLATGAPVAVEPAHAETAAELQARADEALNELSAMEETANQYYSDYLGALSEYENAVVNRNAAQAEIDRINARMAEIQDRLGDRARSMYRSGASNMLDLLLGSTTFEQFTTNWDLLGRMNDNDAALVQEAKDLRAEQDEKRKAFEEQAALAQTKANEANEAYQKAQEAIAQMQEVYNALSAEAQAAYAAEAAAAQVDYYAAAAAEYGATINSDGSVYDSNTGTTYSSVASYASATGNSIVDRARAMIGSAYVWGGTGGSWGGFDCSGLVSYAITGEYGNRLGTTYTFMGYQQAAGAEVGDLVVNAGHVAIVSGVDGSGNITSIIHAVNTNVGVAETGMTGYFDPGDYTVVKPY